MLKLGILFVVTLVSIDKRILDMIMATAIDESNEYFDLVSYPAKTENLSEKQGVTIKGTTQEFLDAAKALRCLLADKDGRLRMIETAKMKLTGFKKEKDGNKCIVNLENQESWRVCQLSVFHSGTILLSRVKNNDFEAVMEIASSVIVPILKKLIDGNNLDGTLLDDSAHIDQEGGEVPDVNLNRCH